MTQNKSGTYLLGAHGTSHDLSFDQAHVVDYDNQIFANALRAVRPDLDAYIPLGTPEDTPSSKGTYKVDSSKAAKELGLNCEL